MRWGTNKNYDYNEMRGGVWGLKTWGRIEVYVFSKSFFNRIV